jgi:SPASM domain peptide maturase of grasp-with-spasm system
MYFNLYPTTVITRGKINSLIFNYTINEYFQIPNHIADVISKFKKKSIKDVFLDPDFINVKEKLNELINWLVANNFGTITKHLIPFTKINTNYNSFGITNAIVEVDGSQHKNDIQCINSLKQLNDLGCESVEIRILNNSNGYNVSNLLEQMNVFNFNSIELLIENNNTVNEETMKQLCYEYISIKRIVVFNYSFYNKILIDDLKCVIQFSDKKMDLHKSCGAISKDYFIINQRLYIESQNHNSCLNQKISVDVNGEIKNCPSMAKSYGNVKNTTLQQALDKQGFKDVWTINKDKITVCKDCEFRHVCTDCRAYVESPDNIYSKPLKCGYNPYTSTWEDWSTNPLKQKAINYYGFTEFVINL